MNDCMNAEVRDALPDLLHGRLNELNTATMKAHVDTCADCRAELELLTQIRASAPIAPRIDVSRIVAALPAPMPSVADQLVMSAPARRSSSIWKMTAAAALLAAGGLTYATGRRQATNEPVVATSVGAAVAAAPVATSAVSPVTVASAPAVAIVASPTPSANKPSGLSLTGGVQDLSDDQLASLVNSLDNVEALPSSEPEPVTISVDEDGLQ